MKKLFFILLISLLTLLKAAGVEAVLSQNEIVLGNSAQLKIIAEGESVQFPRIDKIDDVPVIGRSQTQHTSLQIINGKSTVAHTTNLILTFTPEKDMDIPSFTVKIDGKEYQTKPLHLRVVKSTAPGSVNSGMFSLSMKADKHTVFVGEPLLVTVYFSLRNDVRLSDNPQYNRPEFKGFFVKEIGDEKSYNQGNYRITELRYVLTPQKEGNFTIAPATAKIGVADTSRRDIFGRYFGTIWKPIASNALDVEVKPLPADADLVGHFTVDTHIDNTSVKANKPVNLTVTIEGEGSLDDFTLENYEIDGVTVYSDDAEVTTEVIGEKLRSTYVKKFVFISDRDFEIPSRILRVYDPQSKTVKDLKISSYHVTVDAGKVTTSVSPAAEDHSGEVQTDLKMAHSDAPSETVKEKTVSTSWWMIILSFVAGMVTMYLTGLIKWKSKPSPFKESEALKILYGHMSEDPEAEAMVRRLYAKKNGDKSVIIDKKELRALVEKYQNRV